MLAIDVWGMTYELGYRLVYRNFRYNHTSRNGVAFFVYFGYHQYTFEFSAYSFCRFKSCLTRNGIVAILWRQDFRKNIAIFNAVDGDALEIIQYISATV